MNHTSSKYFHHSGYERLSVLLEASKETALKIINCSKNSGTSDDNIVTEILDPGDGKEIDEVINIVGVEGHHYGVQEPQF